MKRCIVAVYDKISLKYGDLMTFENWMLAQAVMRRQVRDLYFSGDISYDRLTENDLVCIGEFDDEIGSLWSLDEKDYISVPMSTFIRFNEIKEEDTIFAESEVSNDEV